MPARRIDHQQIAQERDEYYARHGIVEDARYGDADEGARTERLRSVDPLRDTQALPTQVIEDAPALEKRQRNLRTYLPARRGSSRPGSVRVLAAKQPILRSGAWLRRVLQTSELVGFLLFMTGLLMLVGALAQNSLVTGVALVAGYLLGFGARVLLRGPTRTQEKT